MTPYNLEVLIHFHCSNAPFPREDASIFAETIEHMVNIGLLEWSDAIPGCKITDRGRAHVHFLCMMPLPIKGWSIQAAPQTFYTEEGP